MRRACEAEVDHEDWVDQEFGRQLEEWRNQNGLTRFQAAKLIGMDAIRLEALEQGYAEKSVTEREVSSIAEVYGISLELVHRVAIGEGVAKLT